jgi:hypothetical protein
MSTLPASRRAVAYHVAKPLSTKHFQMPSHAFHRLLELPDVEAPKSNARQDIAKVLTPCAVTYSDSLGSTVSHAHDAEHVDIHHI